MWNEIFTQYVLPVVSSTGFVTMLGTILFLWIKRGNVKQAAYEAAASTVANIKGKISVDIHKLVEERLRKAIESDDKKRDAYYTNLTELIGKLGSFFATSSFLDEKQVNAFYAALEKTRNICRGKKDVEIMLEESPSTETESEAVR